MTFSSACNSHEDLAKLPPLEAGKRRFFFIRHAETEWNVLGKMQGDGHDMEINDRGAQQAERIAEVFYNVPLDIVASSPLQRARQTADRLFEKHPNAKQRIVMSGLRSMCFGEFQGKPWKLRDEKTSELQTIERFQYYNNLQMEDKWVCMPGGESLGQLESRALESLLELRDQFPKAKYIVIVSHGRVNGVLMASLIDHDARRCHDYLQKNCDVNAIDWKEEDDQVELVL